MDEKAKTTIVIDEAAYAASQKYIDNLTEYFGLDRVSYSRDLTEDELISQMVDVAMKKRRIQLENNDYIFKYVVPTEKGEAELTPELAAFYLDMCAKLRSLATGQYFDRGLNLRLMRLRNRFYKQHGDVTAFLHSVYYIIYFSMVSVDHTGGKAKVEGRGYLSDESVDEYLSVLPEPARFNFFDILFALVYEPSDFKGCIERHKYAVEFVKKHFPEMLKPDFYRYTAIQYALIDLAMQFIDAYEDNPDYFSDEDIEYMRAAEKQLTAEIERGVSYQQEAASIVLLELRFVLGMASIEETLDGLMEFFSADTVDGLINRSVQLFRIAAVYVKLLWKYSPLDKMEKYTICEDLYQRVARGFELIGRDADDYYNVINRAEYISNCSKYMGFERMREQVLQTIVRSDKMLYVHTKMVRHISMIIVDAILDDNPEFFDGVAGYDANFIARHPIVLKELMSECALFHDVGKYYCLDYVSNSSRNLTDDEFMAIKYHPENFDKFFEGNGDEEFECVRDCARLHHLWHNGKGGYPMNLSHTGNLPMVDVLSIADSIDAATDIIGRPYTSGKTLDSLIEEFDTFRDTRYSAYVVDILKRSEVKRRIEYAITTERKHINYEIVRE